jgi:hypothetical protein
MCRDIIDTPGLRTGGVLFFRLVAAVGVDGEFSEDFAGAVLDGRYLVSAGEQDDVFVFVGAADAQMAEPSCVAEGDFAVGVDAVGAHAPVFALGGDGGGCFGSCRVALGRGAPVQSPVGAFVVVDLPELVQLFVEIFQRVSGGLSVQPFLQGLVEAFDFALGLGARGGRSSA